jgi:hypothetical protein
MHKKKKEAAKLALSKAKEMEKWGAKVTHEGPNKDENDKFLEQFNILYSNDFDFTLDENVTIVRLI